jgi:hypothetical protein
LKKNNFFGHQNCAYGKGYRSDYPQEVYDKIKEIRGRQIAEMRKTVSRWELKHG